LYYRILRDEVSLYRSRTVEHRAVYTGCVYLPLCRGAVELCRGESRTECTQEVLDQTVNELRDRVEMPHLKVNVGFTDPNWPDYGYELSPLLYEIRRERAVELVGEGFRWDDIVRWKAGKLLEAPKSMLGMKVSDKLKEQYDSFSRELTQDNLLIVYPDRTTRKWDDKLYLHPLPIDETTMNPNLLPNNPGWE
jgi:hypothetical protein